MTAAELGPLFESAMRPGDPPFLTNPVTELERRFAQFHRNNPEIFQQIERRALVLAKVGERKRIGIAEIVEDIRYDGLTSSQGDRFKINNSFRAFYARLLIHRHSALASVIGLRRQTHYQGAA